jgi:hypothetical protein
MKKMKSIVSCGNTRRKRRFYENRRGDIKMKDKKSFEKIGTDEHIFVLREIE